MAKTESFSKLQQGDRAPDFSLPGIDGATHSLDSLKGAAGTCIVFICNHCPYVKARIAEVVALHQEFGDTIGFIAINSSDPEYPGEGMEASAQFAAQRAMKFAYLYDEDGSVAHAYGATCTPDPFLFDKDLRLAFHGRLVDALEPSEAVRERTMRQAIQKVAAGERVEPWFDPSLGCSIKFKGT